MAEVAALMSVVGFIVGVVVLFEFFHIGYLVNAIRKDTAASLAELRAIKECLTDRPVLEGSKIP